MTLRSVVRGVGARLPDTIVTKHGLAARVDTSDAWIRERTGIRERRIAAVGEKTSDLAEGAARAALADATRRAHQRDQEREARREEELARQADVIRHPATRSGRAA